jgi:hypothetical protein
MRQWLLWVGVGLSGVTISVASAAVASADDTAPPADDLSSFPLASGNYASSGSSYGWVFFTTPDGRSCGIAPNGGPIGCDAVPVDALPKTNQTYADAANPAQYRYSDTPMFTRDALVLPAGQRVQTVGGTCAVDYQGAVHCTTEGNHGFILSIESGVLW